MKRRMQKRRMQKRRIRTTHASFDASFVAKRRMWKTTHKRRMRRYMRRFMRRFQKRRMKRRIKRRIKRRMRRLDASFKQLAMRRFGWRVSPFAIHARINPSFY